MSESTLLDPSLPVFGALRARYQEPQRHYHTMQHVDELLALLSELCAHARRPDLIAWAIWFHDAVYDPTRSDNEARSAQLAHERLSELSLLPEEVAAVVQMVMATAGHQWRDGQADSALFLDLDLSILAARPERYDEYVAQVRAEYAFVPEVVFRGKRAELVRVWLARPSLYVSEVGRERFESEARNNLARELAGG